MLEVRLIGYWRPSSVPRVIGPDEEVLFDDPESRKVLGEFLRAKFDRGDRSEIARQDDERWPEVRDFVDPIWDARERQIVADHLAHGERVNEYRGISPCRVCGRSNGSAERTDGVYCWPEGLAHYVIEHQVRLPDEFVAHVLSSTLLDGADGLQLDQRAVGRLSEVWSPDLGVAADPTWWLEHQRL